MQKGSLTGIKKGLKKTLPAVNKKNQKK